MSRNERGEVRKYELMVIVKAALPDNQKKLVLKKIQDSVKDLQGSVEEENIWGKRHLAFPIKKHKEGYYVVYNISLPASAVKELSRLLLINADVDRHLLCSVDSFGTITVPVETRSNVHKNN